MRHLAAAALIVACIALPACAQRTSHGSSSSHGSFPAHSAPAFHASSRAPAPGRAAAVRSYPASRPLTVPRASHGSGVNSPRSPYTGSWRYRRPYRSPYQTVISYAFPAYGFPGFVGSGYLASSDAVGDDGSSASQNSLQQDDDDRQPDDQGPPPWPFGSSQPAPASAQSSAPDGEDAVTLIFKDGRPPQQIHNYILTRDTLFVGDRHHADIPVDQLDIDATVRVNRDAGVDFHLPDKR